MRSQFRTAACVIAKCSPMFSEELSSRKNGSTWDSELDSSLLVDILDHCRASSNEGSPAV